MFVITRLICRRIHGTSDVTVPKLSGFSILSPKHVSSVSLECFFFKFISDNRKLIVSNINFKVEVEYADDTKFKFSSEFLRVNSPAADGKIRSIGGDKVKSFHASNDDSKATSL